MRILYANELTTRIHHFDTAAPNLRFDQLHARFDLRLRDQAGPVSDHLFDLWPSAGETGPPAVTGFAGGRPKVEEVVAYWPSLIPKSEIEPRVELIES